MKKLYLNKLGEEVFNPAFRSDDQSWSQFGLSLTLNRILTLTYPVLIDADFL